MALDKQVNIYSIDTSAFYDFYESIYIKKKYDFNIYKKMVQQQKIVKILTTKFNKFKKANSKVIGIEDTIQYKRYESFLNHSKSKLNNYKSIYDKRDREVKFILNGGDIKVGKKVVCHQQGLLEAKRSYVNHVRDIMPHKISEKDGVSIFDSFLSRQLGLRYDKSINDELFVVRVYYFHILRDLMDRGFYYNGEKYIFFGCSAGQIRQKKAVFIKESVYNLHEKTIMCGLTMDEINKKDGMNVNKFMAYTSLVNSATEVWDGFDIDKSIVVQDFETINVGYVDYITYEEEEIDGVKYPPYSIVRRKMEIPINHTDGFGIMLDGKTKMTRLPYIKGLMGVCPYDVFIRETRRKGKKWFTKNGFDYDSFGKVKDIYGKEYDILEDDIRYIFTKSQFKMWNFYNNWQHYKNMFKKYGCEACVCNEEEDVINNARLNYQMLQTLSDAKYEELDALAKETNDEIVSSVRDRKSMLKIMGVDENFKKGTYLQNALKIYPELLADEFVKDTIKQNKASLVKQGRSGRVRVDGKYTFVCPDVYAFMEWLFLGIKNPKGLLDNGEVSCSLYENDIKLDCLRSPHLSVEHAIRKNVITKDNQRWYKSKSIYTSIRDLISKILMFDCDGDKLLVCKDETLIKVAERNVERFDIVPLYYNMKKAKAEMLNNESLFNGLKNAYVGGNIGIDSNKISKCINNMIPISDEMTEEEVCVAMEENNKIMKCVKLLCMHNNFEIDYAKCLFSIEFDEETNNMIKEYTGQKLPHFFRYAKDKEEEQTEDINNSTVNKLFYIIKNTNLNFAASNLGKYDYKMLMRNPDVKIDQNVIGEFEYLKRNKKRLMAEHRDGKYKEYYIDSYIRNRLLRLGWDLNSVTDMLVKYCCEKRMLNKNILWNSFGDAIVENLSNNVPSDTKLCEVCGERFVYNTKAKTPKVNCIKCQCDLDRVNKLNWWNENKKNKRNFKQF